MISFFFITFIAYTPPLSFLRTFIIIPSHFTPYTLFHSLLLQPLLPPQNHSDSLHSHLISTPTDLATSSTLYQFYNTTFHTLFSITLFPIYKFQLYHPMQISIVSSYNWIIPRESAFSDQIKEWAISICLVLFRVLRHCIIHRVRRWRRRKRVNFSRLFPIRRMHGSSRCHWWNRGILVYGWFCVGV